MSKRPPPRRQLVNGTAASSSVGNVCIACAWRKTSNVGLKELRANEPAFSPDEDYSGILAGFHKGQVIMAQYVDDRQVGFVAIPVQHFEAVLSDLTAVFDRAIAEMQAEVDADLDAAGEEPFAGDTAAEDNPAFDTTDPWQFSANQEPDETEEEEEFNDE
jgi:hypothetical protein